MRWQVRLAMALLGVDGGAGALSLLLLRAEEAKEDE